VITKGKGFTKNKNAENIRCPITLPDGEINPLHFIWPRNHKPTCSWPPRHWVLGDFFRFVQQWPSPGRAGFAFHRRFVEGDFYQKCPGLERPSGVTTLKRRGGFKTSGHISRRTNQKKGHEEGKSKELKTLEKCLCRFLIIRMTLCNLQEIIYILVRPIRQRKKRTWQLWLCGINWKRSDVER